MAVRLKSEPRSDRSGAFAIIAGAAALLLYGLLIPALLPVLGKAPDFVVWITSPAWRPLAALALFGLASLLFGLTSLSFQARASIGRAGRMSFGLLFVGLLMTIANVSAEPQQYPVIGAHPQATFLIRDKLIYDDPVVVWFRLMALTLTVMGGVGFNLALVRAKLVGPVVPALQLAGVVGLVLAPLSSLFEIAGICLFGVGLLLLGFSMSS